MTSGAHYATTMKFNQASGPHALDFAATVVRWRAGEAPTQENGEVCVVAVRGPKLHLLYREGGLMHGLWRSDAGRVHVTTLGRAHTFTPDGDGWRRATSPLPGIYTALWGADEDCAFGVGLHDTARWDGTAWRTEPSPGPMLAIHGASRDLVLGVGLRGLVARWDGAAWRPLEPPCDDDLVAVHVAGDDDVWALDAKGTIYSGGLLGLRPVLATGKKLRAVARFQGAVWVAVDGEGLFRIELGALKLVKDTFKPVRLEARGELLCASPEAIVGTRDGAAFKGTVLKAAVAVIEPTAPLGA